LNTDKIKGAEANTTVEIQGIVDAVKALYSGAAGKTPPTKSQLQKLGIAGVTDDNLSAVQAAIAKTKDDGSGVNELAELQALVKGVQTKMTNDALTVISAAAQANNATSATHNEVMYAAAGVQGVTKVNRALVNEVLNTDKIKGAEANTTVEIQGIVDAVKALYSGAAGKTSPTKNQLQKLGIAGVTDDNLSAVQAAIAKTKDDGSGVNELAEVQALVRGVRTKMANDALKAVGVTPELAQPTSANSIVSSTKGKAVDMSETVQQFAGGFPTVVASQRVDTSWPELGNGSIKGQIGTSSFVVNGLASKDASSTLVNTVAAGDAAGAGMNMVGKVGLGDANILAFSFDAIDGMAMFSSPAGFFKTDVAGASQAFNLSATKPAVSHALAQPMNANSIVSSTKGNVVDGPEAVQQFADGFNAPNLPTVVASQRVDTSWPELGSGSIKGQIGTSSFFINGLASKDASSVLVNTVAAGDTVGVGMNMVGKVGLGGANILAFSFDAIDGMLMFSSPAEFFKTGVAGSNHAVHSSVTQTVAMPVEKPANVFFGDFAAIL
jgi:hypothetical protein